MQNIIFEDRYEFIPPIESVAWCWFFRMRLKRYLRKAFQIHEYEFHNAERIRQSIDEGYGVVLAPNHSKLADPLVMGMLAWEADVHIFSMAGWHLFKEGWYQQMMLQRMGAFSVYREGNDRQSISCAIDLLVHRRRPLVIFAEGAVSRHCDLLMDMMDGPGFVARQATKRRIKEGKKPVVVLPVTIRYSFDGDPYAAIEEDVEFFESRFSWQPQTQLTMPRRLRKIAEAVLAVKELEYLGTVRAGHAYERADNLAMELLDQQEDKWNIKDRSGGIVSRVKNVRAVILPDMIEGKVTPEERESRWRDLGALYYAQQMAHYPRDYIVDGPNIPERVLETIERLEEDFTDRSTYHGPLKATAIVGDSVEVPTERDRSRDRDPVMEEVGRQIQSTLDELSAARPRV